MPSFKYPSDGTPCSFPYKFIFEALFYFQLAAAKQQKANSEEVTQSTESVKNGSTPKPSKDHQQLQQQFALHQLMQLQQMQQQQQQQAAAAAALQQHSLAAAMAMAQSRPQSYLSPGKMLIKFKRFCIQLACHPAG